MGPRVIKVGDEDAPAYNEPFWFQKDLAVRVCLFMTGSPVQCCVISGRRAPDLQGRLSYAPVKVEMDNWE